MDTNIRNIRIGDVLLEYGYVNEQQIEDALAYQRENKGVRIGGALVALGYINEDQLLQALSRRLGMPVVDISEEDVDTDAVEKIPHQLAEKYEIIALRSQEDVLTIALNDPMNFYGIEDIRQLTGMQLNICLSQKEALNRAIHFYYTEVEAKRAARAANQSYQGAAEEEEDSDIGEDDDETPVINFLNRLLSRAYAMNASDIHIEPFEHETLVRMRIDGVIMEYVTLKKNMHAPLIARIKILGGMDIAERRIPQDGHFRMKMETDQINLRVSVIPTVFGEKAVLRLLSNNSSIDYPKTFGMEEDDYEKMQKMLHSPNGIIYFTGPTGSGKTTTLYMILEALSRKSVNISTIEDPVEKNLPKINQMQVNNQAGLNFEIGLRALLRQDPDVIMVGETRDVETASISVRAAITGHLVLSTLHTNDAASSVSRLEDMGLEPYLVSGSLVGIIAQRLVRKLCPECSYESEATEEEMILLGQDPSTKMRPALRRKKGCTACNYTGYKGRIAVHEILLLDKQVRKMILDQASAEEITEYAVEHQNMRTLKMCGVKLVLSGVSTIEELRKIAYDD